MSTFVKLRDLFRGYTDREVTLLRRKVAAVHRCILSPAEINALRGFSDHELIDLAKRGDE